MALPAQGLSACFLCHQRNGREQRRDIQPIAVSCVFSSRNSVVLPKRQRSIPSARRFAIIRAMNKRQLTPLDRLLASANNALRTVATPAGGPPAKIRRKNIIDADLNADRKATPPA